MLVSIIISGFLSDKFGRKKIIILKIFMFIVLMAVMIVLGFISTIYKEIVLVMYFVSLVFATFTFDIVCLGFESLTKASRENFIITLSATKTLSICILCALFYFLSRWYYIVTIITGLTLILVIVFMKYTFDSPHFILASTGNIDLIRYVLNSIS